MLSVLSVAYLYDSRSARHARGKPGHQAAAIAAAVTPEYKADGPAPAKLTYKLDGSESKNTIAARGAGAPTAQVSKAM